MAVVLAVICLPVILMSLETDAQPTLEEVVEMIRSIQQENAREIRKLREDIMDEIRNLKTELVSNTTECECVAAKPSKQELISAFVG